MKYRQAFTLGLLACSLPLSAAAQSDAPKAVVQNMNMSTEQPEPTEAQKSFDAMKTFAGEWEGPVTIPEMPGMDDGKPMRVTMRVTSRGHVIVHEFQEADKPLDATKYDHPVTMLYVDGDKLDLIHYCDAGNRPHMIGKISPDGKTVDFTLVDVSGSLTRGHMQHAAFTFIDANHHTEDWTYAMPGDKLMHAHFTVHRVN